MSNTFSNETFPYSKVKGVRKKKHEVVIEEKE